MLRVACKTERHAQHSSMQHAQKQYHAGIPYLQLNLELFMVNFLKNAVLFSNEH